LVNAGDDSRGRLTGADLIWNFSTNLCLAYDGAKSVDHADFGAPEGGCDLFLSKVRILIRPAIGSYANKVTHSCAKVARLLRPTEY
jgi:hypothetical protein